MVSGCTYYPFFLWLSAGFAILLRIWLAMASEVFLCLYGCLYKPIPCATYQSTRRYISIAYTHMYKKHDVEIVPLESFSWQCHIIPNHISLYSQFQRTLYTKQEKGKRGEYSDP